MSKLFAKILIAWYRKNARDLPWRHTRDPYKIWISEIMLHQTTVNAVIPYYEKWIKAYPTVEGVAKTPVQKILKSWQGLGYYSRAKNIHASASILVDQYKGQIPRDPLQLKKLPGFGPYTIGAVLSIAFDIRHPIIDANVRRVVMRLRGKEGFADTSQDQWILDFLDEVMPRKDLRSFNQAMMELGALTCRNRQPLCLLCPVKTMCKAYQKGIQEIIPTPKKKNIKEIEAAIAVIERNGKYFIQQRSSKGLLADLWEFPGGKIEPGESPKTALLREVKEELGVDVTSARHIMNVTHYYTEFKVKLHVYACDLKSYPSSDTVRKWVSRSRLKIYPMPSGSAKIVDNLIL